MGDGWGDLGWYRGEVDLGRFVCRAWKVGSGALLRSRWGLRGEMFDI